MFFNVTPMLGVTIVNAAIILFILLITYHVIRQSKKESAQLIQSTHSWKTIDVDLLHQVAERTAHIEELLMQQKTETAEMSAHIEKLFLKNCKSYQLTSREQDIALLIRKGQTYKSIGECLFISDKTVAKHVQHIFEKVCVNNKVELIHKLSRAEEG